LATIFIVGEDITPLDTADDNVLQEIRNVDASGTWHEGESSRAEEFSQCFKNVPLDIPAILSLFGP
jgi:hypothetical protein